eukprot:14261095-Alexandrium_andersonii.AAC.1
MAPPSAYKQARAAVGPGAMAAPGASRALEGAGPCAHAHTRGVGSGEHRVAVARRTKPLQRARPEDHETTPHRLVAHPSLLNKCHHGSGPR